MRAEAIQPNYGQGALGRATAMAGGWRSQTGNRRKMGNWFDQMSLNLEQAATTCGQFVSSYRQKIGLTGVSGTGQP